MCNRKPRVSIYPIWAAVAVFGVASQVQAQDTLSVTLETVDTSQTGHHGVNARLLNPEADRVFESPEVMPGDPDHF